MNKSELAAAMAEKAGLSKADAANALNAYIEVVKEELAKGESISLIGFGTMSVVDRPERTGHNPATGEKITIAAKKSVKFKAGKGLI